MQCGRGSAERNIYTFNERLFRRTGKCLETRTVKICECIVISKIDFTLKKIMIKQVTKKKPFSKRAFIATALLVSVLSLPFAGFMNHNLQFDKLNLERHF